MNGQPGTCTEDDGKRSFTRVTGVVVVAVLLVAFMRATFKDQWATVSTMFDALLLFAWALYGTNKLPAVVSALTQKVPPAAPAAQPQPGQPVQG